jgi:hypothetical protein
MWASTSGPAPNARRARPRRMPAEHGWPGSRVLARSARWAQADAEPPITMLRRRRLRRRAGASVSHQSDSGQPSAGPVRVRLRSRPLGVEEPAPGPGGRDDRLPTPACPRHWAAWVYAAFFSALRHLVQRSSLLVSFL